MVADTLVYHPSVAHYLRFVATTVGRDKLLRTVQFFARFYAWYLLRTNGTAARIAPWDLLKRQLSLCRRILRLGKPVEHLKAAAVALDSRPSNKSSSSASSSSASPCFLRYAALARQLSYAAYLSLDAVTIPDAMGLRKSPRAPALQRQASRCWAAGLLFSLAAQLYTLRQLKRREAGIDRKDGEGVVESKRISIERSASQLQLVCDLCDLTIPTSALGWLAFDDGFVGLAGTLSSLIGIYTQWNKTA